MLSLGSRQAQRKKWLQEIQRVREVDESGQRWSKQNYKHGYTSYASQDHLHILSAEFSAFESRVDPIVTAYFRALGRALPRGRRKLIMTDLWANVMSRGCRHKRHQHPNSQVSGVYYLKVPRGAAPLVLWDPRGDDGVGALRIVPREDQLVLFPSWLWHEVPVHQTSQPRIGLSFNYL